MNFSSDPNAEMGRANREKPTREAAKTEIDVDTNDEDGPMDLSMPRYPNRKKETRVSSSYYSAGRRKQPLSYDVDTNEQPIDYSKKYVESNSLSAIKTNYVPRNSLNKVKIDHREREKGFSQRDEKTYPYGDYAETDLDQPTDYSLRYAEDDTDDDEKQNNTYFNGNEQEDTVKTYCTEGTPYETPFNVSSATSMSDLRLEDAKDADGSRRTARKIIQEAKNVKDPPAKQPTAELKKEEKREKDEENEIMTKESKNINNELVLNSSSASIEKPVNYYDEGTPGRISRVSSLSSLGYANGPSTEDIEETPQQGEVQITPELPASTVTSVDGRGEEIDDPEAVLVVVAGTINDEEIPISCPDEEKEDARVVDKEGKVVTFGGEDHYAEQTPLMFSRSSSLGSLSGFEQHSIHDDRSSIVSDFSRRTSGVVSPSELPDSPTQTVPPSPRHNQKNHANDFSSRTAPLRHFSYVKSPRSKSSVFEDNVTAFKEESTPIEFSAATSLSSLTIDDEPKIIMDTKEKDYPKEGGTVGRFLVENFVESEGVEIEKVRNENGENRVRGSTEQVSDGDEDDEDILAACISMGMRNSMYKKISDIPEKVNNRIFGGDSATNLVRYETSSTLDCLVADVAAVSLSPTPKTKNSMDLVAVPADSVRVYCTEDTPANISPVGSQSNLSALSILSISGEIEKDEANRLSEEDDDYKILEDCMLGGVARTLEGTISLSGTAAITEFNSPNRNVPSTVNLHEDGGSNSFDDTAAVTKQNSPQHSFMTKKPEGYLPNLADTGQTFSVSTSSPAESNDAPSNPTSPAVLNLSAVDIDTSDDNDKILDDCINAGIERTIHGANSFPSTATATKFNSPCHKYSTKKCHADDKNFEDCGRSGTEGTPQGSNSFPGTAPATKHNSPHHVSPTMKFEVYLARAVDEHQVFSTPLPSPAESNDPPIQDSASRSSNSNVADHDTSGDDEKILDDCIRAGIARTLQRGISFPSTVTVIKHPSPNSTAVHHDASGENDTMLDDSIRGGIARSSQNSDSPLEEISTTKYSNDEKILDDRTSSGMAGNAQGSNSFPGTAAATKHNSPHHASSTQKFGVYLPANIDNRQVFSRSPQSPMKNIEPPTRRTSSRRTNSNAVDHNPSGDDEKILDDCIKTGIAKTVHGGIPYPGTAAVTQHHSPSDASLTKKTEAYLAKPVDARRVCQMPLSSPAKSNAAPYRRTSSMRSNFNPADHDTSGEEDVMLDDCIRAGIARTLQGAVCFPSTQAVTKNYSPRRTSPTKKSDQYIPRPVDPRRSSSVASTSPARRHGAPNRSRPSSRANSTAVDQDTSGDDEKILDDCIRVGIERSLHKANSFPSTAATTNSQKKPRFLSEQENNSPRHATSTNKYPSGDKILEDCIRSGMARNPHGSNSLPGTVASTKHNSPRHTSSTKRFDVYLPTTVDNRQASSMSSQSSARASESFTRRGSSRKANSNVVDHDTSGDDEKILDDCIKAGIARTLRGGIVFPGTAAVTKHHSPSHASFTKKSDGYSSKPADIRHVEQMSSSSPTKSNAAPGRHGPSVKSNLNPVDQDTSGDDDKILDDCIRAGIARTLQGAVSFPSNQVVTKSHSPRHASSTKKSEQYLPRPVENGHALSMPFTSPAKRRDASIRSASLSRSNSATVDHEIPSDDDRISDDCIRAGMARTLQGANTFPGTASVAKLQSPRHGPSTKKSELYLPRTVDSYPVFSMNSSSPVKNNDVSIHRTSSPRSNSTAPDHDRIPHDDSPNHSEDEAILTRCIQSAMPKSFRNSQNFGNPHASRKHQKSSVRNPNPNETSSCCRVTTKVFLASVTRILIPAANRGEESFGDHSSLSEDEEDLMLAQCIRSGMPRSLSMPPKETNYQREERRTREH